MSNEYSCDVTISFRKLHPLKKLNCDLFSAFTIICSDIYSNSWYLWYLLKWHQDHLIWLTGSWDLMIIEICSCCFCLRFVGGVSAALKCIFGKIRTNIHEIFVENVLNTHYNNLVTICAIQVVLICQSGNFLHGPINRNKNARNTLFVVDLVAYHLILSQGMTSILLFLLS